jgi:site-specific recombinase XerD
LAEQAEIRRFHAMMLLDRTRIAVTRPSIICRPLTTRELIVKRLYTAAHHRPPKRGNSKAADARSVSADRVKERLAAIRHLFDWLVVGGIVPVYPAAGGRGPKRIVRKAKHRCWSPPKRALLDSIDTATPADLRDRALLGLMVYSFVRMYDAGPYTRKDLMNRVSSIPQRGARLHMTPKSASIKRIIRTVPSPPLG